MKGTIAERKAIADDRADYTILVDLRLKSGQSLVLKNPNIWMGGITLDDAVTPSELFTVGGAIINQAQVVLDNASGDFTNLVFEDAEVTIFVGYTIDGADSLTAKFTGFVNSAAYGSSLITLTCYDNMGRFDRAYDTKLTYPATLEAIITDAGNKCGVVVTTLESHALPLSYVVNEKPNSQSATYRDVIKWAAELLGTYARCDRNGHLEFKWFDQAALTAKVSELKTEGFNPAIFYEPGYQWFDKEGSTYFIYSIFSSDISLDDVIITGVRVSNRNTNNDSDSAVDTYTAGAEGYVVSIENNGLLQSGYQEYADALAAQLVGFTFRKASITHTPDFTLEAGDIGIVFHKGEMYPIIVSSTIFSTGGAQKTESSAETPARNSAVRYSASAKNFVKTKEMVMQEKNARETAVNNLQKAITSKAGLYQTAEPAAGGGYIYYLHDKPNMKESSIVWKMTAGAMAVSTDGGVTWNGGLTAEGNAILNRLSAETIDVDDLTITGTLDANLIKAGVLSDKAGKFSLNLTTGKLVMNDGTFTGTVNAKSGTIGGFTIDDADIDYPGLKFGEMGKAQSFWIQPKGHKGMVEVAGYSNGDWVLTVGENFGVTARGGMYATYIYSKGSLRVIDPYGNGCAYYGALNARFYINEDAGDATKIAEIGPNVYSVAGTRYIGININTDNCDGFEIKKKYAAVNLFSVTKDGYAIGKLKTPGTNGFEMDNAGNLTHHRAEARDTWGIYSNAGETAMSVNYESGAVRIKGLDTDLLTAISNITESNSTTITNTEYNVSITFYKVNRTVQAYMRTLNGGLAKAMESSGAYLTLGTIPSGYRPLTAAINIAYLNGAFFGQFNLYPGGNVVVGYTRRFSDGASANLAAGSQFWATYTYLSE